MAYQLLKGKKGIIFGALDDKSLAWRTALRCHEEGASLVLTNAPVALRLGEINKLAAVRINGMVERLQLSQQIRESVYRLFQHVLAQRTSLLFNRHIDQIILCCFYGVAKVNSVGQVLTFMFSG